MLECKRCNTTGEVPFMFFFHKECPDCVGAFRLLLKQRECRAILDQLEQEKVLTVEAEKDSAEKEYVVSRQFALENGVFERLMLEDKSALYKLTLGNRTSTYLVKTTDNVAAIWKNPVEEERIRAILADKIVKGE